MLAILAATLALAAASPTDAAAPAARELESREKAFAQAAAEKGIRNAFLEFLATDSVGFRPGPVALRPAYESHPDSKAKLIWGPEYVELSGSGEIGFTTGPWEFRPEDATKPSSFGHFFSVWRKNPSGTWRVIADIGIDHDGPYGLAATVAGRALPLREGERGSIAEAEAAYLAAVSNAGFAKALEDAADEDVRVYRDGARPATGKRAAIALVSSPVLRLDAPKVADAAIASDGSMAVAWGEAGAQLEAKEAAPERAGFLHVWRRASDGRWRLASEVVLHAPPDKKD